MKLMEIFTRAFRSRTELTFYHRPSLFVRNVVSESLTAIDITCFGCLETKSER
jgi:hypothetical protein